MDVAVKLYWDHNEKIVKNPEIEDLPNWFGEKYHYCLKILDSWQYATEPVKDQPQANSFF